MRRLVLSILVLVLAVALLPACKGKGKATGRTPKVHRATEILCSPERVNIEPTVAPDNKNADCRSNAECKDKPNGRCVQLGRRGWQCTYDHCFKDADCSGAHAVCYCRESKSVYPHQCLPSGNCRVDSDCAGGKGFCSPTYGSCGYYDGLQGYFCHTPADECVDDDECTKKSKDSKEVIPGTCRYEESVGHWRCGYGECAG